MFSFIFLVFSFLFWLFATHSRKFGTKFPKFFKATELFETRITRMVTNLVTFESIGLGQFLRVRERSRWDRRHKRQSRDGKRRASREASEFQIRVMAPTVLILEEKLAKGVWKMRGWTASEHRGGRNGRS